MILRLTLRSSARLAGVALVALLLIDGIGPVAAEVNVQAFLANPANLLQDASAGDAALVSQIRDLAIANPATLTSIIGLLGTASKEQKSAIASGLAQAAKIIVKTNPPYATQIQQAIADTKDQDFILAYAGAAGDVAIGAAGGGGAGSAGASGGQTSTFGATTGTGAAQAITGSSTPTTAFSYTSSVSSGASTTTTTGTTAGPTTGTAGTTLVVNGANNVINISVSP